MSEKVLPRPYKKENSAMTALKYGALNPSVEEQLNALGFTLGKDAQKIEKIRFAILMVSFHVATDGETDKMFKRLTKLIEKTAGRL